MSVDTGLTCIHTYIHAAKPHIKDINHTHTHTTASVIVIALLKTLT